MRSQSDVAWWSYVSFVGSELRYLRASKSREGTLQGRWN